MIRLRHTILILYLTIMIFSCKEDDVIVLVGYTSIDASLQHSLALKTDGSLWSWGRNNKGQLGDGTTENKTTPVQVGSGYTAIAAGSAYSLAVKTDGTLWAWGGNFIGELGDGTTVDKITPVQVGSG